MKEWIIKDYKTDEVDWDNVEVLEINEYPWYKRGEKQETYVKIAIADNNIRIKVDAKDKYILAKCKNLNDPVYTDSCFEFFLTPWPEKSKAYFNFEINCEGVLYLAYRDGINEQFLITKEQAKRVIIESSLTSNKENKEDWSLDITIPIELLEEMSGKKVDENIWYGNFYRCGGAVDDQHAAWNPLEFERPNFHLPMQFGKLIIK